MVSSVFLFVVGCVAQVSFTAPEQVAFEARNQALVQAAEKRTAESHPGWRVMKSSVQSEPGKGLFRASHTWMPTSDSKAAADSQVVVEADRVVVSFQSFSTEADAAKRLDAVLAHSSLKRESPVDGLGPASFRLAGFVDPGRTVVIFRLASMNVTVDAPTPYLAESFAREAFKALAATVENGPE